MRTREEILKEIEQVDNAIFYNQMVDHWSRDNYDKDRELNERKGKLLRELEAVG